MIIGIFLAWLIALARTPLQYRLGWERLN